MFQLNDIQGVYCFKLEEPRCLLLRLQPYNFQRWKINRLDEMNNERFMSCLTELVTSNNFSSLSLEQLSSGKIRT